MSARGVMTRPGSRQVTADMVLGAVSHPILGIGAADRILFANHAAERFFGMSAAALTGEALDAVIPEDSPVLSAVAQVRRSGAGVAEAEVRLEGPRIGSHLVAVNADPVADHTDCVILTLHERSLARQIDRQLTHRSAARSVSAMGAMLAHEVKNPLSGIRGAAQLLGQRAGSRDRELADLICGETDRIVALVDRVEAFADGPALNLEPVNIHEVLGHVRRLAEAGFANAVTFREDYDPSLPPVTGDRDRLVQAFLNLVKNAAEAVPAEGGEILLRTHYQHGLRVAEPGRSRISLPLVVSVQDNGGGIPDDVRRQLFEPFVSTKSQGSGLGLALVAKIVAEHGGVIDVTSAVRRTVFQVMLPAFSQRQAAA